MEVEINGQKKELKELKYLDAIEVEETRQKDGLRAAHKKFLIMSGLTDEETEGLSLSDGVKIQQKLNEFAINFQNPVEKK